MSVYYYLVNDSRKQVLFLGKDPEWFGVFSTESCAVDLSTLNQRTRSIFGKPSIQKLKSLIGKDPVRIMSDSSDEYYEINNKTIFKNGYIDKTSEGYLRFEKRNELIRETDSFYVEI